MQWAKNKHGFTIVELLIVIVVIAILATITIVSYTGIRGQAMSAKVQSDLSQANDKVVLYSALNAGKCPDTLAAADFSTASSTYFQYSCDNTVAPSEYAITASEKAGSSTNYYVSSTTSSLQKGVAPGQNLLVWDKTDNATAPLAAASGVTIDTSKFRTSTASIRLSPGATFKYIRANPYSGSVGQVVKVTAWVLTDSNWDGMSNNSKIRYGAADGGAYISACPYNGVKAVWTQISCSYTLTAANSSVAISFGNDGSVGNVWIDDVTVSVK